MLTPTVTHVPSTSRVMSSLCCPLPFWQIHACIGVSLRLLTDMSLRTWNTSTERFRFRRVLVLGHEWFLSHQDGDDSSSSSSSSSSDDDSSSDSSDGSFAERLVEGIRNIYGRLYGRFEDTAIDFGQRKTIADFNASQCITEFCSGRRICRWLQIRFGQKSASS